MVETGIPAGFFDNCALLVVDIQEGERPTPLTDEELPPPWRAMGFTAADVNAANAFAWEVCLPNAVRVVEACRGAGIPCIFSHWGFECDDGMDLAPKIYRTMRDYHGADPGKWPGHPSDSGARPAEAFQVGPGDYVVAKTGQDAFSSSNLRFVLQNLGVERLIFVGGHTEACLGKSARSAKWLG